MKALKLRTTYYGRYNDLEATVLMPIEANGSVFGFIPLDETQERVVSLGELEGKHSQCYGDLTAEIIDISTMNPVHLKNLYQESDFSSFESYFEQMEGQIEEYLEEIKDSEDDQEEYNQIKQEQKAVYEMLGIDEEKAYFKSREVFDAFDEKIKEYVEKVKTVTVDVMASDYEAIKELLEKNGFKIY